MEPMKNLLYLFLSIQLFASCSKWTNDPCKHPSGEKGKTEISIQPFHYLEINHHLPCTVYFSDTPKVVIYGPSGSLPFIQVDSNNDTLRIKNNNACSWRRNYDQTIKIEIYTPSLSYIQQKGSADLTISGEFTTPKLTFYTEHYSGNVFFENLLTDSLFTWVNSSGSTHFQLQGACQYAYLFIRGSSDIQGNELQCETAHLVSYSNGNILLQSPKKLLIGEIRYNGNIEVSSRPPQEKIVITGKGRYLHP